MSFVSSGSASVAEPGSFVSSNSLVLHMNFLHQWLGGKPLEHAFLGLAMLTMSDVDPR
jgi:hypothetical protein